MILWAIDCWSRCFRLVIFVSVLFLSVILCAGNCAGRYRMLRSFFECHHITGFANFIILRVLLKAAPRPGGPVALIFHNFVCPAVNPRACTNLHLVWVWKIDYGEFEFGYHFNNHLNPFDPFFRCLLLSEKCCHSLFIRLLTEPDREDVHCQMMKWETSSNSPSSMLLFKLPHKNGW